MKAAVVVPGKSGKEAVSIEDVAKPQVRHGEVLVRMHAASLNFRDLVVAQGMYAAVSYTHLTLPTTPYV